MKRRKCDYPTSVTTNRMRTSNGAKIFELFNTRKDGEEKVKKKGSYLKKVGEFGKISR